MIDEADTFLRKAFESLAGAASEVEHGRYNNAANRCYYACFQAAVSALTRSGVRPSRAHGQWSHAFVPAQFVRQLINRRKLYSPELRDTLARTYLLRQTADYDNDDISRTEAERALRRTQTFVQAVTGGGERQ